MNSSTIVSPQLTKVLSQIEKFGFKFFGYDENNDPLVIAPNGQIIPLKVAYEFVQLQIKKSSENTSENSPESMPTLPQIQDIGASIELTSEKSAEKESVIEKATESAPMLQQVAVTSPSTATPVPPITKDSSMKMPAPFDDGFKIKSFDPTDIAQTQDFVKNNSKASNSSSNKWLSTQFEKFLREYNSKAGK